MNIEKLSKPVTINVAKSGSYLQADQVGELNVTNTINGKKKSNNYSSSSSKKSGL